MGWVRLMRGMVMGSFKKFWLWLTKGITPQAVLFMLLILAILALGAVLLVIRNGPLLVQTAYPYIVPQFPVGEDTPPPEKDRLQILYQRKLVAIDYWKISSDPMRECDNERSPSYKPTACDETHIFESWTHIVPDQLIPLWVSGGSDSGTYGKLVALTGHKINKKPSTDSRKPEWWIALNPDRKRKTDVVITRRTIIGGYQPTQAQDPREPPINPCSEGSTAIFLTNPTGRADLMVTMPPEIAIKPDITFWKSVNGAGPIQINETQNENYEVLQDGHLLYWVVSAELRRLSQQANILLFVKWLWEHPITEGPVCRAQSVQSG